MRLTAKSEYGLLAMVHIARNGEERPVSAREVAETQRIPGKFLEQLLAALRRDGLIVAHRGARGGFTLGRAADGITVLQIVEALEGELAPTPCDGGACCLGSAEACAAAPVWDRAARALRDVLATTTLAQVSAEQARIDSAARIGA